MRTKATAGPLALAFVCAALAGAATPGAAENAAGNVSEGSAVSDVARVSVLQAGSVLVQRAGAKTTVAARLNEPLIGGDTFATTDRDTRVEIQLDGFTDLRLGAGVDGRIIENDSRARRVELANGSIELSLLRGQNVACEIVAPSFTLRTRYAGAYRISMQRDGSASITPRSGQADVVTGSNTVTIRAGNTFVVRGSAGGASVESSPAIARDSFDEFNAQRDRTLLAALDDPQIPATIAGYDDLSAYGRWTSVASYGRVWVPDGQSAGWAPYRDGGWSYIGNDGWTWIGSEPWAWVPYHYGRWLYSSGYNWCWYPPPAGFNPVWAPALVGFFGYGNGPLGYSGIGWVPLAPFEPYVPWRPVRYGSPSHHHGATRHARATESPEAAFRNARFGGASRAGAGAWPGAGAAPVAASKPSSVLQVIRPVEPPLIRPVVPSNASTIERAAPIIHSAAPIVHAAPISPVVAPLQPVVRPPEPSHALHSSLPHPPA
jgi:hypothetical protein